MHAFVRPPDVEMIGGILPPPVSGDLPLHHMT
jgi:hypothetical protein